jgi:hypothetical protein
MVIKVKVHPCVCAATFGAAQQVAIKMACGVEISDVEGVMK